MEKTLRRPNHTVLASAIKRGLEFIYETSLDVENFASWGYDYLGCFQCIASTAKDGALRRAARKMGRERAHAWRQRHRNVPIDADANEIACLVIGSDAADRLGIVDRRFEAQLQRVTSRLTACDLLGFDPAVEPPPDDIPDFCECGADNERGRQRCRCCRKSLPIFSRYAVWLDALIFSYTGERCGMRLGASYRNVLKWLPVMRNYPAFSDSDDDYYWAIYAVTHVVYTLNAYSCYRLSPHWLPQEYDFLKTNLEQAIAIEDPESLGEFMDALKSFGLTDHHPLIRKGTEYLLATQNADGSWGEPHTEDIYQRYHPTWTAIDGLRDYAWRGTRLSFPKLRPLLKLLT